MVIVLMNDKSYGVIKNIQDAQYGGRPLLPERTPDLRDAVHSLALACTRAASTTCRANWRGGSASAGPFPARESTCSPSAASRPPSAGPPTNTITQIPALSARLR